MITGSKRLFEQLCISRGYTIEEVKNCIVKQFGSFITVDENHESYPKTPKPGFVYSLDVKSLPGVGVGTELKKLLSKIGITATPNCSCNKRAALMDINGTQWCEDNIDIIVGWLKEEANKRKLPFIDMAGKILVKRAISNARKIIKENN
jgi:hypothetical protein